MSTALAESKLFAAPVHAYTKILDAPNGVVEAIVSVTGNRDEGGDVILPGGPGWGLEQAKPKGVWSHDWSTPISKTLASREVPPGDKSLPGDLLDAGFGGLWVQTQFNQDRDAVKAREALAMVKLFGDEQEWSIGYSIPPGGAFTNTQDESVAAILSGLPALTKAAAEEGLPTRFIAQLIVWEYSPVLFGMNRLTRTTGAKSAEADALEKMAVTLERLVLRSVEEPKGDRAEITPFPIPPAGAPSLGEVVDDRVKDAEEAISYLVGDIDLGTKAGRVFARRNVDRLRRMRDALSELLDELGEEADDGKGLTVKEPDQFLKLWLLAGDLSKQQGITPEEAVDIIVKGVTPDEKADEDDDGYEPTGDEKDHTFKPDADHPQRCADCGAGEGRPWHKPPKEADPDDEDGKALTAEELRALQFQIERARLSL